MGKEAEGAEGDEYEEVDALEDSDDEFVYEEVDVDDEDDDLLAAENEDLDSVMRSLNGLGTTGGVAGGAATKAPEPAPGEVTKRPEVRMGSTHRGAPFLGPGWGRSFAQSPPPPCLRMLHSPPPTLPAPCSRRTTQPRRASGGRWESTGAGVEGDARPREPHNHHTHD